MSVPAFILGYVFGVMSAAFVGRALLAWFGRED